MKHSDVALEILRSTTREDGKTLRSQRERAYLDTVLLEQGEQREWPDPGRSIVYDRPPRPTVQEQQEMQNRLDWMQWAIERR